MGFVYVSVRLGLVSGRSPESVRFMTLAVPLGSVLALTLRVTASAPPSDQLEPFKTSASTSSSNVTVIEFSDVATALLMAGGVMSSVVSTIIDGKFASVLEEASCMEPDV